MLDYFIVPIASRFFRLSSIDFFFFFDRDFSRYIFYISAGNLVDEQVAPNLLSQKLLYKKFLMLKNWFCSQLVMSFDITLWSKSCLSKNYDEFCAITCILATKYSVQLILSQLLISR